MFSKRILNDIKVFKEADPLNIYIVPDENSGIIRAMIIGNDDTPYKYGFYFFTISFPNDSSNGRYPFIPPKVKFETTDGYTRFNPNLYVTGKVCLSILGTWSGPAWSPAGTFLTVLLSIQSEVMHHDPLKNEPGYQNAPTIDVQKYSDLVEHQNFAIALNKQALNIPAGFECFKDIINESIANNKENIINRRNLNVKNNYSQIKEEFINSFCS